MAPSQCGEAAGHCSSESHSTHTLRFTSQYGRATLFWQSSSLRQVGTQRNTKGSQTTSPVPQFLVERHCTQAPAGEQYGTSEGQSTSVTHWTQVFVVVLQKREPLFWQLTCDRHSTQCPNFMRQYGVGGPHSAEARQLSPTSWPEGVPPLLLGSVATPALPPSARLPEPPLRAPVGVRSFALCDCAQPLNRGRSNASEGAARASRLSAGKAENDARSWT